MNEKDTPENSQNADVQTHGDGAGPMYHRVYAVDVPVTYDSALKTMKQVMADPNAFSAQLIASFVKTKGEAGVLRNDDEFMVHITGPWQGPVRVSQVTENSFTLLTLAGHLEAGQICFRLLRTPVEKVRFEIESVTRSKDIVVDLFYDKLRLAQFAQTKMWELFCRSFAQKSLAENGRESEPLPDVHVRTQRQDTETGQWKDVSDQFGAKAIS